MKKILDNKSILITCGTGSFGKKLVEIVLKKFKPKKIIIYSRDELKQFEMSHQFPETKHRSIRYFLGDIRDISRQLGSVGTLSSLIRTRIGNVD